MNDPVYIVAIILAVILLGILIFLVSIDVRLRKLERKYRGSQSPKSL